ncbi:ParB/RepB/Spo0J family partition protein [Streptomyces sp. NPDC058284]|uniref:ParB/RepB/Spo0J family partition protein n=1 Tax=unclassified Streptomyces TaxID=2593676 RepID=UPI0036511209
MAYRGMMPTSFLVSGQIQPTEYRRWADARRRFAHRERDRVKVEKLKESIPQHGLREPLVLGVDDRYFDIYVGDGHHRAVALMDLGMRTFPFRWYWIRSFGVHMEHTPFPFHLLRDPAKE